MLGWITAAGVTALGTVTLAAVTLRFRRLLRGQRATCAAQQARLVALEHLAARNEAILQSAMDGFFVLGDDYRFREVNEAFCRITGYDRTELLQMRMTDLEVAQADGHAVGDHWQTGLHHFATSHRHKFGHLIQLESCVIALRDGDDKLLVGFARDVTERLRAELALRDSEAQYRNLVETSQDLIWTLDRHGHWTFVNNAARTIYGCEPEEMLGRAVREFHAVPDTPGLMEACAAARTLEHFETVHRRADGTPVYLSFNAIPVRDERGTLLGYTGTATDVTERRQAEARLREAHVRFESLVQRMPLAYVVWSTDFRVLEWNPAAEVIFGYSSAEAFGQRAVDLVVPADGHAAFAEMCRALLNGEALAGTVLANHKRDGEKIRCEWYSTVLPNAAGGVHGVATLIRDISERERLEAQLRQSQKLESLGVLAGGVAHDFNNLLVGIMGNASLAMEQLPADAAAQSLLERVVNAGRRATDLTKRMLAYAGRSSTEVDVMDLNALIQEMADFAIAGVPKSVALHLAIQPGRMLIKADSSQVQQVIMNLLINAAEALGDDGGDVTVSTWLDQLNARRIAREFPNQRIMAGAYVCMEVRDTGTGMSPEILGRIFDPFFTTKFAGRGLGLSAILGIMRAHHGAITVRSEVGVGTVFRVYFPAAPEPAAVAVPQPRSIDLPRGALVLVIDDEEEIRDVVSAVLSSRGLRVLTAPDGPSGIELFRLHRDEVAAVLLDLNMPGMKGEVVFRRLIEEKPDVKVVLSTGYSEQEAATQFADARLAGFVHKPYTAKALVDKLGLAIAAK
ncbi:MAG: PAS domain S-box protein [Phycisphaerales bacterium]|nr:PAS domain S-box protein [Phycisphaerales bacterium]